MFIVSLPKEKSKRQSLICEFIIEMKLLIYSVERILRGSDWPPDGFRLRMTGGYADVYMVKSICEPDKKIPEFLSDLINLCEHMMRYRPEIPFICHIGALKPLGPKTLQELKTKQVVPPVNPSIELDSGDVKGLLEIPV